MFILAALRRNLTDNAVSGCSVRKYLTYPRAHEERKVRHAAVVEGFQNLVFRGKRCILLVSKATYHRSQVSQFQVWLL